MKLKKYEVVNITNLTEIGKGFSVQNLKKMKLFYTVYPKSLTLSRKSQKITKTLNEIKNRIKNAQTKAIMSANSKMIYMYWDIGEIIYRRQKDEGWGAGIIPKLVNDIKNELPEIKGFSQRNIGRMVAFYREYCLSGENLPQTVANSKIPI